VPTNPANAEPEERKRRMQAGSNSALKPIMHLSNRNLNERPPGDSSPKKRKSDDKGQYEERCTQGTIRDKGKGGTGTRLGRNELWGTIDAVGVCMERTKHHERALQPGKRMRKPGAESAIGTKSRKNAGD